MKKKEKNGKWKKNQIILYTVLVNWMMRWAGLCLKWTRQRPRRKRGERESERTPKKMKINSAVVYTRRRWVFSSNFISFVFNFVFYSVLFRCEACVWVVVARIHSIFFCYFNYSPKKRFCHQIQYNRNWEWDDVRKASVKFLKAEKNNLIYRHFVFYFFSNRVFRPSVGAAGIDETRTKVKNFRKRKKTWKTV